MIRYYLKKSPPHTATLTPLSLNFKSDNTQSPSILAFLLHPEQPYPLFKPLTVRYNTIYGAIAAVAIVNPDLPNDRTCRISSALENPHISRPHSHVSSYAPNLRNHAGGDSGESNTVRGRGDSTPAGEQHLSSRSGSGRGHGVSPGSGEGGERGGEGGDDGMGGGVGNGTRLNGFRCIICKGNYGSFFGLKRHLETHYKHETEQFRQSIRECKSEELEKFILANYDSARGKRDGHGEIIEGSQSQAISSKQAIGRDIARQLNTAYNIGTGQRQLLHGFLSELPDD
ncbi:hypothetical protein BDD12DRAFT_978930, partial [Trichophaea hybrida]